MTATTPALTAWPTAGVPFPCCTVGSSPTWSTPSRPDMA